MPEQNIIEEYEEWVEKVEEKKITRIPTCVDGLTSILCGGIPEGFMVALVGEPGTYKSLTALHIASCALQKGYKVLYVATEEPATAVLKSAQQFKKTQPILKYAKSMDFVIIDVFGYSSDPLRLSLTSGGVPSFDSLVKALNVFKKLQMKRAENPKLLVIIDSVSVFWLNAPAQSRKMSYQLKKVLAELGYTSVVTSQFAVTTGGAFGFGVEHVADGIIEHAYRRVGRDEEDVFIRVKKMRLTPHPRRWFPVVVEYGVGLKIKITEEDIPLPCRKKEKKEEQKKAEGKEAEQTEEKAEEVPELPETEVPTPTEPISLPEAEEPEIPEPSPIPI